jgi:transposase
MKQYVGLDVSMKETSICIVDKEGEVIREVKVATEPTAIVAVLMDETLAIERIGLEAGAFSQWLYGALAEADLPVVCVETRHMKAELSAQRNKTDRNDARGIAQMMRVGLYRPVHVKTMTSQKQRMLLTAPQLLKAKAIDIESELRGTLRNFGLKVGMVGEAKFEARIRELIEDDPDLAEIVEPVLIARRSLREQLRVLHRKLLELVRHDQICRRLMTAPGVGPVVALTFRATVDVPSRFKSSKTVGAAFGLTPRQYQSGETDRMGAVSKCVERFEPEKGFRFTTYAMWWIKAAIQAYILHSWSLVKMGTTANQRKLFFHLRKAKSKIFALDEGDMRPDQVELIAKRLGVTEHAVIAMNRRLGGDLSLNDTIRENGDSAEWQDWLVDESLDQEMTLAASEDFDKRRKALSDALGILNERDRRIFEGRRLVEDPITLAELADEFGVSGERVRQIEARAFEKVQKAVKNHVAAIETPVSLPMH